MMRRKQCAIGAGSVLVVFLVIAGSIFLAERLGDVAAQGEAIESFAKVTPEELHRGDIAEVEVGFVAPQGYRLSPNATQEEFGTFEVRSKHVSAGEHRMVIRYRLQCVVCKTDTVYSLGSVRVRWENAKGEQGYVTSRPLQVYVMRMLPADLDVTRPAQSFDPPREISHLGEGIVAMMVGGLLASYSAFSAVRFFLARMGKKRAERAASQHQNEAPRDAFQQKLDAIAGVLDEGASEPEMIRKAMAALAVMWESRNLGEGGLYADLLYAAYSRKSVALSVAQNLFVRTKTFLEEKR